MQSIDNDHCCQYVTDDGHAAYPPCPRDSVACKRGAHEGDCASTAKNEDAGHPQVRRAWMALCECLHAYITFFMCLPRSAYRVERAGETETSAAHHVACASRFHVLLGRQSRIDRRQFVRETLHRLRREHHDKNTELDNQRCPICLKEFARRRSAWRLPCGHAYHQRCIVSWFAQDIHMTCPLCRADFVDGSQCRPAPKK